MINKRTVGMNIQKQFVKILSSAFPYILFVIAATGPILAYKYYGVVFTLKSLGYVIPIILVAIILLIRHKDKDKGLGIFKSILILKGITFLNLLMITVLFFVVSVILLIHFPTRPLAYFIIVALTSGSIFIQIFTQREKWTDYLIIFEIIILSLNLIWGVVLKYPLYFGGTDILGHLFSIETILQTGHTTGLENYVNYPLYHIYNAIGIEITGLVSRTSVFLFMGIAWVGGILLTYLLFMKISSSRRFSLTACLLYAMSPIVVLNGMSSITRSLAFVLILCLLYQIFNKDSLKYVFLSLITMFALILTHHATILLSIPILIVIYFSQRVFQGTKPEKALLTILPIMVLTISFFGYMFFIASDFTLTVFARQLLGIFTQEIGPQNVDVLHQQQYFYVLGSVDNSFVLLLALIGIGIAINLYASGSKHLSFVIIGLPSLLFLILYFDNISQLIPYSKILLFWRLPILASFFIVYMVTYGINYLMHIGHNTLKHKIWLPVLSMIAVVMLSFFSLISSSTARDLDYIQKSADVGSHYFTDSELNALSFIRQECNYDSIIYGD